MDRLIGDILKKADSPLEKKNLLREFLQEIILRSIYELDYIDRLIFTGGTALRFAHGLKRFSEDLDYTCSSKNFDFQIFADSLLELLKKNGLVVSHSLKKDGAVNNIFIKFHNLLGRYDRAFQKKELLKIKLAIDLSPPSGGKTETLFLQKNHMFYVNIFELPALMSGKIHALLYRPFLKGRDIYDLIWYLGKKIKPDPKLLKNAILQTATKTTASRETNNWPKIILQKLDKRKLAGVLNDVLPFLENPAEARILKMETLKQLLGAY